MITYKFYNKKGERLTIHCDIVKNVGALIRIKPCSKRDNFSKKLGYIYVMKVDPSVHPEITTTKQFMDWCRERFLVKEAYIIRGSHLKVGKQKQGYSNITVLQYCL